MIMTVLGSYSVIDVSYSVTDDDYDSVREDRSKQAANRFRPPFVAQDGVLRLEQLGLVKYHGQDHLLIDGVDGMADGDRWLRRCAHQLHHLGGGC
jgi:hypothetical protein